MLFYATSVHFLIYLFWIRAVRMVSVGETEQYHSILWDMQQHFIQILQYNGDNNFYNATRWCNAKAIYCVSWVVVTSSKSACWTVWYGVAHNSIFLHLFSILLLRLSVRENTATAKSHFTGGKRSVSDDYPIFSPECRHFILDLCTSKSIRIFR